MVPFESALERDLATLLEFDDSVESYAAQPVRMEYLHEGRRRSGVPDFLVTYRPDTGKPPTLCDVKYRAEIFARWKDLKPRLRAAKAHADSRGWRYQIMTEVEIRTPFLLNARFLLPYRNREYDESDEQRLLKTLQCIGPTTPTTLLRACENDPDRQTLLIPALWSLIARYAVMADLETPITMDVKIWCAP